VSPTAGWNCEASLTPGLVHPPPILQPEISSPSSGGRFFRGSAPRRCRGLHSITTNTLRVASLPRDAPAVPPPTCRRNRPVRLRPPLTLRERKRVGGGQPPPDYRSSSRCGAEARRLIGEEREEAMIGGGEANPDLGLSPLHGTTNETSYAEERPLLPLAVGPARKRAQTS
jgi:hypothetical protein